MTTSVTDATPAGPGEQPSTDPAPQAPAQEAQTPEPAGEAPQSEGLESLPETWQQEVQKLRRENAERRTKYNDLKTQLDAAKTQEDIDAAVSEYKGQVVQLERQLSIESHTKGLPEGAAELVTGDTDEEIKASAEKVRKLLEGAATPPREPDLDASGGTSPRAGQDGSGRSPRELAREALDNGRRR